jgi:uncharacterized membrane protein YdjX (TVP38/TMEM64 family)
MPGISSLFGRFKSVLAVWGPALPLAGWTFLGPVLGVMLLAGSAGKWYPPLQAQGGSAALWVAVATTILAGLALMPTHAASLVSGMLFGWWRGSLLALASTLVAALLGYTVLRRLAGPRLLEALEQRPRARAVHAALLGQRGWALASMVALLRLSPLLPFAATNLAMASSRVALGPFLAGTALGIAPRVTLVALTGSELAELDLSRSKDQRLAVLGILATLLVLAIATRLARRALAAVARPG